MEQTPQMRPVWEDNFNILKKSKKKKDYAWKNWTDLAPILVPYSPPGETDIFDAPAFSGKYMSYTCDICLVSRVFILFKIEGCLINWVC
jgi:hypothetical protein